MLKLVLGTSGHGKTEYLYDILYKKVSETNEDAYIVVPDQLSFTVEKNLLNRYGAKTSSKIKVWSFNKLSEEVFRLYGGIPEKPLTETGKFVMLKRAIKLVKDELKIYHKSNDNILKLMAAAIDEFKTNVISPEDLFEADRNLKGNLKDKLHDIALIYETYNALNHNKYIDESDVLTRAFYKLYENDFLENAVVAFDGFESFNKQKLKIIEIVMKKAEVCYISLNSDTASFIEGSLFEPISKTVSEIRRIAANESVKESVPVYFKEAKRFNNDELKHLESNLLRADYKQYLEKPDNITIFEAKNIYDELEYVAASIRNLVIDENYRYGDFAIVCKDPGKYYKILNPIFEKWEIPCYFQEPIRLDTRPIIRLITSSYKMASRGFRSEEILSLLKTGLTLFSTDEISEFENYLYLWKIDGNALKNDFFKHPKGFGYELSEEDEEKLSKLNLIRKSIVEPILKFKEKIKDVTAREIGEAIYELLLEFKTDVKIGESFTEYIELGMPDLAREGSLSWQKLMDILDEFTLSFENEILSAEDYFSVFKDVVSKAETRDIPMRMDTVTLSSSDVFKPDNVKVTFIIGAVQGEFPYIPSDSGLFTDSERNALIENSISMESRLEEKIKSEIFLSYASTVSPSDKLYVCYHLFAGDEETTPGRIVTDIKKIFPLIEVKKNEDISYFANTYNSSFAYYASLYNEESASKESLKKILCENKDFENKLLALDLAGNRDDFKIKDKELSDTMFSDSYFSASQVESYHKCAFSYFCRYGLNLKEKRSAEIDNLEYGTIMHFLFESILKSDYVEYIDNREKLITDVNRLIDEYSLEKMGGMKNLSGKDKYRFKRLTSAAISMIERFIEELSISQFEPKYFELYLSDYSDFPPLKIKNDKGKIIKVGGIADRIDVYNTPSGKYIRVVDYKTGTKEFKYSDVLFGLNLQMLIYLAALSEKGQVIPSGILYLPSSLPEISGDKNASESFAKKEKEKKLAASGIVLDDIEIVNAMEEGAAGRFLPTGIKDNGSYTKPQSVINEKGFELLFSHIKNLIKTMSEHLIEGDIPAIPLMVNNNSCTYCPYGSICGNMKDDRLINKIKLTKEDVLNEIEKIGGADDANVDRCPK